MTLPLPSSSKRSKSGSSSPEVALRGSLAGIDQAANHPSSIVVKGQWRWQFRPEVGQAWNNTIAARAS